MIPWPPSDLAVIESSRQARPAENDPVIQRTIQRLLGLATERRIESHIDEMLDREDDVLV